MLVVVPDTETDIPDAIAETSRRRSGVNLLSAECESG